MSHHVVGRTRGMRSFGLSHAKIKQQLQEWLDLSIQKNIPIALLIMSRAFMLNVSSSPDDGPEQILVKSMSSLNEDVLNEVVVSAASPKEEDTVDIKLRKLESLQFQKEVLYFLP
jgi:LETM1 and EF-hand domain-containing protein 1